MCSLSGINPECYLGKSNIKQNVVQLAMEQIYKLLINAGDNKCRHIWFRK